MDPVVYYPKYRPTPLPVEEDIPSAFMVGVLMGVTLIGLVLLFGSKRTKLELVACWAGYLIGLAICLLRIIPSLIQTWGA